MPLLSGFEHIPYEDFSIALNGMRKVLNDNGILILSLPNSGIVWRGDIKLNENTNPPAMLGRIE